MSLLEKRSRKMNKGGQVTIFIIVGIAVVLIAGAFLLFRDEILIGSRIGTTQIEPVKEYFEECVTEKLQQELRNRKMFGGRDSLDYPAPSPSQNLNILNKPTNKLPPLNVI